MALALALLLMPMITGVVFLFVQSDAFKRLKSWAGRVRLAAYHGSHVYGTLKQIHRLPEVEDRYERIHSTSGKG